MVFPEHTDFWCIGIIVGLAGKIIKQGEVHVEKWHPNKVMMVIAIMTLGLSITGGAVGFGIAYGTVSHAISMCVERLDRHANQIKESEKRMDASEIDRAAIREWIRNAMTTLDRIEERQITSLTITKHNSKVNTENNKILKEIR
jgi:hypothetical protein